MPLELPSAGVEAEFLVLPLLPPWFVDVLQGLEGQDGGADLPDLAIPDEFHLPFVGKEHEAVFVRQGYDEREVTGLEGLPVN